MHRSTAPVHPLRFGRRAPRAIAIPMEQESSFVDDLKLFGLTFGAGFVFVSVYLV